MLTFLGIGAQKAATTWLFENLDRHPQIGFPGGKEIHFWNRRMGRDAKEWLEIFSESLPQIREGEITPAYAFLGRSDILQIHHCRPDLRIFYSVRDPIERAWSGALMALSRAELEVDEASDQWFIDHFQSRGSLARGDYARCYRRWVSVFPSEQILVLFFDDIVTRPRQALGELARHIDVDAEPFDAVPDEVLARRVFSGLPLPLRPSLLPVLRQLYEPRIEAFERLIGRDLSSWRATAC